jgi:signal transduction histidine kinase
MIADFEMLRDTLADIQRQVAVLASMSHELRTPLNAIIGLTEMLTEHAPRFGTEKALEPLRRVLNGGCHLLNSALMPANLTTLARLSVS